MRADFFYWRQGEGQQADLNSRPTMVLWGRKVYQVKSPIFVFKEASARTRITLLAPANARVYYTDWATWTMSASKGESEQAQEVAAHASSVVSVPRCGDDVWGIPGMLLLEGPTCLTFRVTGQDPDWQESRTVPFGKERC